MSRPNLAQLQQALTIATQIESLKVELASIVAGSSIDAAQSVSTPVPVTKPGRRTMSAAARAKIAAAQKVRWAKVKGETSQPAVAAKAKSPAKGKARRIFSPEARAKMAAAAKARWAKVKKAKG